MYSSPVNVNITKGREPTSCRHSTYCKSDWTVLRFNAECILYSLDVLKPTISDMEPTYQAKIDAKLSDHYIHEAIGELIGPGLIVRMSNHLPFPEDPLPTCLDGLKLFETDVR